ncbi:MAG: hypothetical protein ACE5E7_16650, partial [Anaerolineae bacterium]
DPPIFTKGADQTVNEDSGAATVAGWATGILPGPATATDESGQVLTFTVTNDNNTLFSVQPAVAPNGDLSFTPAGNLFGTAVVTVTLQDNGGGDDTSAPQSFSITVNSVNDAPTFTPGPDQVVGEDSGTHTIPGWATGMSAGPANESGQNLTFLVSTNNANLLQSLPTIDPVTGDLVFTTKPDANGLALITVRLQDDGGVLNGGSDTSDPQQFLIQVNAVNDPPTVTDITMTGAQDANLTFTDSDFIFHFNDVDADSLTDVKITTLPVTGTLYLTGTTPITITAGQIIPVADLGKLVYVPAAGWFGADSFSWNGSDGSLYAITDAQVNITISQTTYTVFLPLVIKSP